MDAGLGNNRFEIKIKQTQVRKFKISPEKEYGIDNPRKRSNSKESGRVSVGRKKSGVSSRSLLSALKSFNGLSSLLATKNTLQMIEDQKSVDK